MEKIKITLLKTVLISLFSAQAQASLIITQNNTKVEISGLAYNATVNYGEEYDQSSPYASTTLPFSVPDDTLSSEGFGGNGEHASSEATLYELEVAATTAGYKFSGGLTSSVETTTYPEYPTGSATALSNAVFSLNFTLTTNYHYTYVGYLSSQIELGDAATNPQAIVKSEINLLRVNGSPEIQTEWNDQALTLTDNRSGVLEAGDYSLLVRAYSESLSGELQAYADTSIDLQLTAVPLPAGLPLFLSGVIALGFKRNRDQKALL